MFESIKRIYHNIKYGDFLLEREMSRLKGSLGCDKSSIKEIVFYQLYELEMERNARTLLESGVSTDSSEELVVSLTTYGKRIYKVHLAIESLLEQTMKPTRIVLYVDKESFSQDTLPIMLKNQQKRGLEVHFVKDIRSYTKLLPALKEYPHANIVTVDDDLIYSPVLIERLWKAHMQAPKAICFKEGRIFGCDPQNRQFIPYNDWIYAQAVDDIDNNYFMPEGFGGILYPPNSFTDEIFNESVFLEIAPSVDDIWFRAMSLLKKTPLFKIKKYDEIDWWIEVGGTQDVGLKNVNNDNLNNVYVKKVFEHYNLFEKIKD